MSLTLPVAAGPSPVAPTRPRRVVLGRRLAVTALVAGSLLNAASSMVSRRLLDPDAPPADRAVAITEHTTALSLALVAGIVAVPLMLLAFQALAALVRPVHPRLAAVGAGATFVGCFGFLAIHVPAAVEAAAVLDGVDPAAVEAVLAPLESSLFGALLVAPFLLGLFGGLLVLAVGLWRSRAVPRWVPSSLVAFLSLDFLASGRTGQLDPHPLWVAACLGAAVVVARRSDAAWENG